MAGTDTVVWSDDQFYRIPQDSVPFRLKPMTPILFNTTHSISRPIGKFSSPTFEGSFVSLHTSSAIRVVGSFSKTYLDKVTFSFNPNNLLTHPSQATFHAQSYSLKVFDSPVEVQFSVLPRSNQDIPYPFIKSAIPLMNTPLVEPSVNILPDSFLHDLADNSSLNILFGIGIPENNYFPTLSFRDFCEFQNIEPQNWKRLCHLVSKKYQELAKENSELRDISNQFVNRISKHAGNENKSSFIFWVLE